RARSAARTGRTRSRPGGSGQQPGVVAHARPRRRASCRRRRSALPPDRRPAARGGGAAWMDRRCDSSRTAAGRRAAGARSAAPPKAPGARSWPRSTLCGAVASIGRILGIAVVGLAVLLRIWRRAVLLTPEVKRRKAARRAL